MWPQRQQSEREKFEYFTDEDDITIPRLTSWSESIITQQAELSGPGTSGSVNQVDGAQAARCGKCNRRGHSSEKCKVHKCTFGKKMGQKATQCWSNPKSPVYKPNKGSVNTVVSSTPSGTVFTLKGDNDNSETEDHDFTTGQVSQVTGSVKNLGVAFGMTPTLTCTLFRNLTSKAGEVTLLADTPLTGVLRQHLSRGHQEESVW